MSSLPESQPPLVVAVCGPVGAGKTTLASGLAKQLAATAVYFDDYEQVTESPLSDVHEWIRAGADPNQLSFRGLPETLADLKKGMTVGGRGGTVLKPTPYVIFETQFGRQHEATGCHIDFLVWLDTPLDVALARKVREFVADFGTRPDAGGVAPKFAGWLEQYLGNYIGMVRDLLQMQRRNIMADADLVLDGMAPPEMLIKEVALVLESRFGN